MSQRDESYETYSASWSEIKALIRKYWLVVLVVFVAGTLGTYLTLQIFFTNQYESQVSLLVKVGRENAEVPVTVQNGQVLSQGVRIADINSEVQMLSSRQLVDRVVDEIGPERFKFALKPPASIWGYPKYYVKRTARWVKTQFKEFLILANIKKQLSPREQAIVGVHESVVVEPVKESDVLILKVRMPDAQLSVDIAKLILQYYLEERGNARKMPPSQDFFAAQMAENRKLMEKFVSDRADLRKRWGISAVDQQRGLMLQQSSELQRQLAQDESEIALRQKQGSEMKNVLAVAPDLVRKEQVVSQNPAIPSIKDRITALQVEHAKIASGYQPDSAMVKRIEEEIAELQATLDRETATIVTSSTQERNPVAKEFTQELAQSSVRIAGLGSHTESLKGSLGRIQGGLARLNEGSDAYDAIQREYLIAEQNHLIYAKKQEEARIAQQLDSLHMTNVAIMSGPELPIEPIYPRHLFILEFALPLSLLLGIAFAALWESLDDRIRDEDALRELDDFEFLGSCKIQSFAVGEK